MDDIIIIVLTLLFTIVAAINQSKKKKGTEVRKIPDFWKEILQKEVIPGMPDLSETPRQANRMRPSPSVVPPVISPVKNKVTAEEGVRNEIITGMTGSKMDETEESLTKEPLLEDFSLRKAFIYSEIISAKFFSIN